MWTQFFTDKWQLKYQFTSISSEVLDAIIEKCNGNPLLCLQYFVNLLQNGYINILDKDATGYGVV